MPRIEPYQLLKCLSVLLGPSGGIRSSDVVHRIVSLMTKFSKKLVSKCIYILILKSTEVDLLDMFMSAGGWDLTFSWLSDGIQAKNWPLVVELVELLLICPVDIERLKGNTCPKLIKLLSKDITATENVRDLAGKVVEQWLAIVKGACEASSGHQQTAQEQADALGQGDDEEEVVVENGEIVENGVEELMEDATAQLPVYKITIRDGKQVLAEVISSDRTAQPRVDSVKPPDAPAAQNNTNSSTTEPSAASRTSVRLAANNAQSDSQDGRALSEVPSSESDSDDEVRPVQIGRKRPSSASKKEPVAKKRTAKRPSPSSNDPDFVVKSAKPKKGAAPSEKKMKLEPRKEKKEERGKGGKPKDEQSERDKSTLAKLIGPPLTNLGKIPKKSKEEEKRPPAEPSRPPPKDPKKYNISVETRKGTGERPNTVKMFNSKFRKTGLEEVPPPPPVPKSAKKSDKEEERKPIKRSSPPPKEPSPVVEKKLKEEEKKTEKPLTPPKSKIMILQESDVFADALTAANPVRDVKKKKRRTSLSSTSSDAKRENSHDNKKSEEKKSAQDAVKPTFKFYQDTLVTSEDKNGDDSPSESKCDVKPKTETKQECDESDDLADLEINDKVCPSSPVSKEELEDEVAKAEEAINQVLMMEDKRNMEREKNRLPKGILVYVKKRKAVKKGVQWKPDKDLEATRYFELDETERVNVTKPFMDMKQMERINEREHVLLSRKLAADDIMEEKTAWRSLIPVDIPADQVVPIPGKNSLEKEIQYARERTTLQAIYFNRRMIPESASEPDLEIHAYTEPAVIPLDDQTGNAESVMNYKNKPWPEPKGYAPGSPEASQGLLVGSPGGGDAGGPYHQVPGGGAGLLPHPHPHPHHHQPMPPPHHQQPMPPPHYPGGPYPGPPMGGPPGPAEWMGDGNMMGGGMMMGGGGGGSGDMMGGPMMGGGPPDQQQQQQQQMYPMGGPHHGPEFMGGPHPPFMGPPHPPFMGPPHPPGPAPGPGPFAPNQPPHDMHRPPRPWFRQNAGTWRHPSKGGGSWNHKSRGMCNHVLKKGFCRVNKCPFRHPPGSSSSGGGPPPSPR